MLQLGRRIVIPIIVFVVIITGLIFALDQIKKTQEIRKKAAGNVTLTLSPSTTSLTPGATVDVRVLVNPNGDTVSAAQVVLNIAPTDKLDLVNVTQGDFFPATTSTTEILKLGVTCAQSTDCRPNIEPVQSAIHCNSTCQRDNVTPAIPTNSAGTATVILGAPCDSVTHLGCLNNACVVLKGTGTDSCQIDSDCAGNAGSGTQAQCYPQTWTGKSLATFRFQVKSTATAGNVAISFNTTDTQVAATNQGDTNVASPQSPITLTIAGPTSTPTPTPTGNPTTTPTATPIRTPTPTPTTPPLPTSTASPLPNTSTLIFNINLGAVSLSSATKPGKTVKVTLKQGTTVAATFDNTPVTWNSSNNAYRGIINNITPGTYDVFIKEYSHLQKKFPGVALVADGQATIQGASSPLIVGDTNNDNLIQIIDIAGIISIWYSSETPVSDTNRLYDLNNDGIISISDIAAIISNWITSDVQGEN